MLLTLVLSVVIGVSLGLLGGGASILTVPMLLYVAGLSARAGVATSLFVVGTTSFVALLGHARSGRVDWRVGGLFGTASMMGGYAGGRLARFLPAQYLLLGFTCMMFVTALAMMRRTGHASRQSRPGGSAGLARAALVGVGIGVLTGLIGAGGGFVIVPALVLVSGLPIRTAIGTSLLVITMNSFAGFAGTLGHASIPWALAAEVAAASATGSLVGAPLAKRVGPELLRKGFAWFVLAMALLMAAKQLPAAPAHVCRRGVTSYG
jgi:uncharacterized membrane protein YfcA